MKLVIMGQGYVGLPMAMRAVEVGHHVVGFEVDKRRLTQLASGESFVEDVSHDELAAALATGRYEPSNSQSALVGFDVAVISVPTPLRDGSPDLSYVVSATAMLAPHVTVGCSVVLESTTYPGTTEELVVPVLQDASGLSAGVDFHVGYSPERIDPGNVRYSFRNTPKVVSGVSPASCAVIEAFYQTIVDETVPVPGPKEAELSKLLENTFRHVNIALVNELAVYARELGIDIWSVIDAAATKPFGFMKFTPGPGVGGHCLPIDPSYLSWQVKRSLGHQFRFVELANDVNEHMPDYVVTRIQQTLNELERAVKGSVITLIGLSYKKNSGDARESPAIHVAEQLHALGAVLQAVDPCIRANDFPTYITPVELDASAIARSHLVVILTDHDGLDYELLQDCSTEVFDTRNRLTGSSHQRL